METLNILKAATSKLYQSSSKAYLTLGLFLAPALSFADGSDLGTAATHMSSEANALKIFIFNAILVVGAISMLAGFITIFRKHVEHKWGKVATLLIVGALCMAPRLIITTATQSTLGATTNASQNTTQEFSAGGQ